MKYIWEERDIRGGTIVRRGGSAHQHAIVYDDDCKVLGARYGIVDMVDGCVWAHFLSTHEMAELLTKENMRLVKHPVTLKKKR